MAEHLNHDDPYGGEKPPGGGSDSTHTLRYCDKADPEWEKQVDAWKWKQDGPGSWHKEGVCPHCGHDMTIPYELVIEPFAPDGFTADIDVRCTCDEAHPPEKEGAGCGRVGRIKRP